MKTFFKIVAFLVAGYVLATARLENNLTETHNPTFSLYDAPPIAKIHFDLGKGSVQTINIQEQGSTLHVTANPATWTTPWTAYVPFYQTGRIEGIRTFQYHIDDQPEESNQVTLIQKVRCVSALPRPDRAALLELVLATALKKSVIERAQSGNKYKAEKAAKHTSAPAPVPVQ